jgi:hypothetical protein
MLNTKLIRDSDDFTKIRAHLEECGLYFHHRSTDNGYVSKKIGYGIAEKYAGHFGSGVKIRRHNPKSTQYCIVEYWIRDQKNE